MAFHHVPQGWEIWSSFAGPGSRGRYCVQPLLLRNKPLSAFLDSVSPRGIYFKLKSCSIHLYEAPDINPSDFNPILESYTCPLSAFQASMASSRVLLDLIDLPPDGGQDIVHAISSHTAVAVSDGSFNPTLQRASSSFIIALAENSNIDILLSGSNFVPGLPEGQSAYCSKLAGILGVLCSVEILVTHFHTTSGTITIALDGESALDEARGDWPLQIHQPHFDLLQVIRVLVKRLPITVNWKWARGHQHEKGVRDLDWWAQMNDKVDSDAKQYLAVCSMGRSPDLLCPVYYYAISLGWSTCHLFVVFANKLE